MSEVLRVVLHSNIVVYATRSRDSKMMFLWDLPAVDILISPYVLAEISRHLALPEQRARLWQVLYKSHLIPDALETRLPDTVLLLAKDEPILKSAIAAQADVLVTGDVKHFRPLFGKQIAGVMVEQTVMFKARYPQYFSMRRAPA